MRKSFFQAVLCALLVIATTSVAWAFKFSDEDGKTEAEASAKAQRIAELASTPCGAKLKGQSIMTVIAERSGNGYNTTQSRYGQHFQAINRRLRALGLRTYTQEEIRAKIAQAELDAYFRNDPDAALNAAKKLGANYILRGLISAQSGINPVLRINEVAVNMGFTLTAANGRILSDTGARSESYSGTDTLGMALTLVNEEADEVVAKLYSDYCRSADAKAKSKK